MNEAGGDKFLHGPEFAKTVAAMRDAIPTLAEAERDLREFGRRLRELDPQIVAEINRYEAEFGYFAQFSGEDDES